MTAPVPAVGACARAMNSIRYYSMLESSGYGLAAIAYIEALKQVGVEVYWTPLVQTPMGYQPWPHAENAKQNVDNLIAQCTSNKASQSLLKECLVLDSPYDRAIIHTVPEYWPVLNEPGIVNMGYTVWETDAPPAHFPALINQMDKLLVPANFNRTLFKQGGVDIPIEVIPHILIERPKLSVSAHNDFIREHSIDHRDFVFYAINEWSSRKAIWILIDCYLQIFSGNDAVTLIVKTSATGPANEQDDQYRNTEDLLGQIVNKYSNPGKIKLINTKFSAEQIAALHNTGDCYVSTTHSEGWGLGSFEAAGYGNAVLITGWGGQLDYLKADLAYLIDYKMTGVEDKHGGDSYTQNQRWAEVDQTHLKKLFSEIVHSPQQAKTRAHQLAEQLRHQYNSQTIGNALRNALYD